MDNETIRFFILFVAVWLWNVTHKREREELQSHQL